MTDKKEFLQKEKQITQKIDELDKQVQQYTKWAWRSVIGGFVVLLIALVLFFVPNSEEATSIALNKMEEFAKFLGSIVAAIWTLSGLFFVYVAFLGQKQSIQNQQLELFYNREELKATREELAGQKQQMIEQNKTLKQQQFENTFFQLFTYRDNIINNLTYGKSVKGTVISLAWSNFQSEYINSDFSNEFEKIEVAFQRTINEYPRVVLPLITCFLQLIQVIDKKCPVDKLYYIQLIISVLSVNELLFFIYYFILEKDVYTRELFIKYRVLDKIPCEMYLNKEIHKNLLETNLYVKNQ